MRLVAPYEIADVLAAVDAIAAEGRKANLSAVARRANLSRTRARYVCDILRARRILRDEGKGGAYNWRRNPWHEEKTT